MKQNWTKSIVGAVGVFLGVAFAASEAGAATLIDGATPGLYNNGLGTALDGTNPFGGSFMFPAGGDPTLDIPASNEPDLSSVSGVLGDWLTNPGSPGGSWSAAEQAIPSSWAVFTETAIIYELDGGADGLTDVVAQFGVDNGIFVWLNGTFLGGSLRPGGAIPGEFTLNIGTIGSGMNYLQVLREDHGGGTGYSVLVEGNSATISPVPLPASGWLMVAALGLIAATRRRKLAG